MGSKKVAFIPLQDQSSGCLQHSGFNVPESEKQGGTEWPVSSEIYRGGKETSKDHIEMGRGGAMRGDREAGFILHNPDPKSRPTRRKNFEDLECSQASQTCITW